MGQTVRALLLLCVTLIPAVEAFTRVSSCNDIHEYNVLYDLMNTDSCMSADSVFKYLHDITEKWHNGHCRVDIIQKLSEHFGGSQAHTPDHCQCTGTNRLEQYVYLQGVYNEVSICTQNDRDYVDVYNQFFISNHHPHDAPACRTHHSLWNQLKQVAYNNYGCQKDIVYHLNYAFSVHSEPCTCGEKQVSPTPTPDAGQSQHQGNNDGNPCHQYASYHELAKLMHERGCMSANSVWHLLDDLQVKNANCRKEIQDRLTKVYSSVSADGNDNCNCYSRDHLVNKQHVHFMDNGSHHECQSEQHTTYDNLERDLFTHITDKGCRNHNYLWPTLAGVVDTTLHCNRQCYHTNTVTDCTADFIVRAAIDYPSSASDSCVCESIATTPSPTTSTAAPIPTTPAPTTTTTQLFSTKYTCNKFQAIEDIAKSIHVTHPDSTACDPNSGGSDDAYTIVACNMTSPTMWHKGINVMQDCRSSTHAIPTYIPIATFSSGSDLFVPNGAQSGIFLGCQGNGFKMAVQKCNDVPKLIIVENGTFVNNPDNYYVVV